MSRIERALAIALEHFTSGDMAKFISSMGLIIGSAEPVELEQVVQSAIDHSWYKALGKMLTSDDVDIKLRVGISSIFVNLACGSDAQTLRLIEHGHLLVMIRNALFKYTLAKEHIEILDNLLSCLDNMVTPNDPQFTMPRDVVLQCIGFQRLVTICNVSTEPLITTRVLELILDMIRLPGLTFRDTQVLAKPMLSLLANSKEEGILFYALKVLCNLTGTGPVVLEKKDIIERVSCLARHVLDPVSKLLQHPSKHIAAKSMHIMANLVAGTDHDTMMVLESGVVQTISQVLTSEAKLPRQEWNSHWIRDACLLLSNSILSSCDDDKHSRRVVHRLVALDIIKPLLQIATHAGSAIRREILITIRNCVGHATDYLLHTTKRRAIVEILCNFLRDADETCTRDALTSLVVLTRYDLRVRTSLVVLNTIKDIDRAQTTIWDLQSSDDAWISELAHELSNRISVYESLVHVKS